MLDCCKVEVILHKLLGLDIVHAMDTRNAVTVYQQRSVALQDPKTILTPLPTYPTDNTRPVSARPASSCTPRILCSNIEETSVGEAFASAA